MKPRKRKRVMDASKFMPHVVGAITLGAGGMSVALGGKTVAVPGYYLPSKANQRLHWRAEAKQKAAQYAIGKRIAALLPPTERGCEVILTRVGPRLLDDDNLASAFKAIRDGVAAHNGVDDGPTGPITWRYQQRKGPYAIEVTCEARDERSLPA